MRKLTFTPSSLDKYATNGVQRSVTPEAFSAGTTAKVSSGNLAFQSCADAEPVNASAAAPARMMRRVIMITPLVVVTPVGRAECSAALIGKALRSGRGCGAERRNGCVVGRRQRRRPHDVIGLEVVELARNVLGQHRRSTVEHDA